MANKRATSSKNTNTKSKKLKQKKQDDEGEKTYTPHLPDLIVHQILLLLPIEFAVRASFLSKQWALIWSSLNVEVFQEKDYLSDDSYSNQSKFFAVMGRRWSRREKNKHDLEKFRLRMRYPGGKRIIDKWLNLALNRNVKELDISLRTKCGASDIYQIPETLLNAKCLTALCLENVMIQGKIRFDHTSTICLPSLKTLSLKKMHPADGSAVFLLTNYWCPFLECLSLAYSCHFGNVKITCSSLKSLEVIECIGTRITVEVMNLELIKLCGDHKNFKIDSCSRLRNLELVSLFLNSCTWFGSLLDITFPLLESLILHGCNGFPVLTAIFHPHLKRIVFHECKTDDVEGAVCINAPNLLSFEFSSAVDDSTSLLSRFYLPAPNLAEATINLNFKLPCALPLLNTFLGSLDRARTLNLRVNLVEALVYPEEVRNECSPPLPNLKNLNVTISSARRIRDISALRDSLRWMAPLVKILSVKQVSREILYEELC